MKKQMLAVLLALGLLIPSGAVLAAAPQNDHAVEQSPQLQAPPPGQHLPRDRSRFFPETRRHDRPALFLRLVFLKAHQEELGISGDQLAQVEELTFQMEEIRIQQQNLAAEHRLELKKLMMEESKDYTRIESLMNQTAESRNRAIVEGMKISDQIESVFTPDQLDALKKAAREEMAQRRPLLRERINDRLSRFRERPRR